MCVLVEQCTNSNVYQIEDKTDTIHRKTSLLLAAFEGSHPLVPRRKQSAYELERGPIYPETEAEKWTSILQDGTKTRLSHRNGTKALVASPQKMTGTVTDVGIRTDPSLEVYFNADVSDASKDARQQTFRRKTLDALNPT